MTDICDSVIHICRIRVTRVDSVGEPIAGPNNVYVSDKPMMLVATPDVLAGEVKDQKGGCDQLLATYRGQDILKRYNLELDQGVVEPGLEEMLTGGAAILDGSNGAIGVWFASPCGTQQPFVCFEAWQDLWDCDHQPASPYQFVHWIWPSSRWQKGAITLQNDFTQPKFLGFSVANPEWGLGIYGDLPEAAQPNGGYFFSNALPTASCGYQSHTVS